MRPILFFVLFFLSICANAQEPLNDSFIDVNYFRGNISLHNDGLLHLISGHPEGVIIGFSNKTFGNKIWEQAYNFPDHGVSVIYQDLKNHSLGNNIGIYGHFNFYFFKRNVVFRVGQGLALSSNPYHRINNPKNIAFGSKLLSSTYVMFNYKKERLFKNIGFQAGLSLIHYSNANVKAPNTSVNIITANAGLVYNLADESPKYKLPEEKITLTEPIKLNFVFSSGINESDVINSGRFPFYVLSAYADKRINYKSAFQFGAEVFISEFLKEYIAYEAVAFPNENIDAKADYKRIGIFIGHELFINKLSIVTQAGFYAYYPYDFEGRTYLRLGLKRYFGKKWFAALSVKAHGTAAEAVELGIGIRL